MAAGPHPTNGIADEISKLEARAYPAALVYSPLESVSGKWEAVGEGWTLMAESPVMFADRLARLLGGAK